MTNQHQITPPDDLIDRWGDLDLPWTQKAKLIARWGAAAALAQPSPEGELTDEELLRTYGLAKRDHCYEGPIDDWPKRAERAATIAGLRAAIAADRARRPAPEPPAEGEVGELVAARLRYCPTHGQQPANAWGCPECVRELRSQLKAPAQGEVAELVAALRQVSDGASACDDERTSWITARAAELLQRQHPQPVPVSEQPDQRHPDCVKAWPDCWDGGYDPRCCRFPKSCSCEVRHDLPLPSGEVAE